MADLSLLALWGRIAKEFDLQKLILKRATITGSTMRARNNQEKHRLLNLYMNIYGRYWSKASVYHKFIKRMLFQMYKVLMHVWSRATILERSF